jgi:glucose-1-phosphate cytidylyltransferase
LAFTEKPPIGQGLINGGFFCFRREFLKYLDDSPGCALEREPLERCAAKGDLCVYEHQGFWQCMDTYRDWQSLEAQWQKQDAPWNVWDQPATQMPTEIPERWRSVAQLLEKAGLQGVVTN